MSIKRLIAVFGYLLLAAFSQLSYATAPAPCQRDARPAISFVSFGSFDPDIGGVTVKGKLKLPVVWQVKTRCYVPKPNVPAVVVLHGSAGVDFRGDFYASALNAAGIATLEIDMWEARGLTGIADSRPALPANTYPDAFAALAFLSFTPDYAGIINPARIGVLGFSWGGVISVASATEGVVSLVSDSYFGGVRFKAHAANYPVCYAYNNTGPGSEFGTNAGNPLTGAPLLIQIGSNDDYDRLNDAGNGTEPCLALKYVSDKLTDGEKALITVNPYQGAYHAWDRLMVPSSADDSFAHFGTGGPVNVVPSVDQAYESRDKVVKFFKMKL